MSQDRLIPFPCPAELRGQAGEDRDMANVPPRMNDHAKPREEVRGCVRGNMADPPLYYFEVWTDLGGECRLAVKSGGPFRTRSEAQRACEDAKRRYKAVSR